MDARSDRPSHLLLVDDDPAVLRTWQRLLTLRGYACTSVGSVEGALAVLEEERIDLIVADIDLGVGTGLDLVQRRPPKAQLVPVILVTGVPSLETAVEALRLSVIDYVTKPAIDLPQRVDAALRRADANRRLAQTELALSEWSGFLDHMSTAMADLRQALTTPPAPSTAPAPPPLPATLPLHLLSEREAEVLEQLRAGLSNKEIAARLFVSEHTVKNHLKAVFRKLDVSTRAELLSRLTSPA